MKRKADEISNNKTNQINTDTLNKQFFAAAKQGDFRTIKRILETKDNSLNPNSKNLALHLAAQYGHLEIVRLLLERGVNVNTALTTGITALHLAAQHGHPSVVQSLIEHGANVNVVRENRISPLHSAAKHGHTAIAQLLIKHGANIDAAIKGGNTALHLASEYGHPGIVRLLLKYEMNIDATIKGGTTALHLAAKHGHTEITQLLLDHRINTEATMKGGTTALHLSAKNGHTAVAQALLDYGVVDINSIMERGITALHLAVRNNYIDVVRALLDQGGIDLSAQTNYHQHTALHLAAIYGHLEIMQLLINEADADINEETHDRKTAWHLAAEHGQLNIMQWLLGHQEVDINQESYEGNTALHLAARHGQLNIVKWLLTQEGVDINQTNDAEGTAWHAAARNGRIDVMEWLITQEGVNINQTNDHGETALHLAAYHGKLDVIQWLLDNGININETDDTRGTVWHAATVYGHLDVMKCLLGNGVNINETDGDGETALHLAARNWNLKIVQWLMSQGIDISRTNNNGENALQLAAQSKSLTESKIIPPNLDINIYSHAVHTQKIYSASLKKVMLNKQKQLIKHLIIHGADPTIREDGETILPELIKLGMETVIRETANEFINAIDSYNYKRLRGNTKIIYNGNILPLRKEIPKELIKLIFEYAGIGHAYTLSDLDTATTFKSELQLKLIDIMLLLHKGHGLTVHKERYTEEQIQELYNNDHEVIIFRANGQKTIMRCHNPEATTKTVNFVYKDSNYYKALPSINENLMEDDRVEELQDQETAGTGYNPYLDQAQTTGTGGGYEERMQIDSAEPPTVKALEDRDGNLRLDKGSSSSEDTAVKAILYADGTLIKKWTPDEQDMLDLLAGGDDGDDGDNDASVASDSSAENKHSDANSATDENDNQTIQYQEEEQSTLTFYNPAIQKLEAQLETYSDHNAPKALIKMITTKIKELKAEEECTTMSQYLIKFVALPTIKLIVDTFKQERNRDEHKPEGMETVLISHTREGKHFVNEEYLSPDEPTHNINGLIGMMNPSAPMHGLEHGHGIFEVF